MCVNSHYRNFFFCRKKFVKKLQNLLHYNNKHLTMFYGLFSKLFLFPIICFCHLSTCDLLFTSSLCLSILTTHTKFGRYFRDHYLPFAAAAKFNSHSNHGEQQDCKTKISCSSERRSQSSVQSSEQCLRTR